MLSRGLGMVRDMLVAYCFGTSLMASAFFVAFTIPNLFRRLFGEGALSAAFIPVLVETRKEEGDKASWKLVARVATLLTAVLSIIALFGVLFFSVALHVPGLSEKWIATFSLSRIMFPYVLFICLAALAMAVLNSYRHFATSAFAPTLLNILLILAMVGLFPLVGTDPFARAKTLAWAALIAGAAQLAIQIPALRRFGCPCRFSSQWSDPRIRQILLLMGPAALGMAVTQFNVLIDRFLALWIGAWAPAALFYSERLIYFPLGVIATAMATVLLPTFSAHAAEGDHSAMRQTIIHSLQHIFFIMAPASIGLFLLAPDILSAIFQNGNFDAQSTMLCARALRFYAPGLVIFSAAKVLVPSFYAMQDTRTPVRVGIWTVLLNLILNVAFILLLPLYWRHAGMAFATVLAEGVGMMVLAVLLARRLPGLPWREVGISLTRSLFFALCMAFLVWGIHLFLPPQLVARGMAPKFVQVISLLVAIGAGMSFYLLLARLFRAPELRDIQAALRKKKK
jgi:putative peptidoglycan lipid II flippase